MKATTRLLTLALALTGPALTTNAMNPHKVEGMIRSGQLEAAEAALQSTDTDTADPTTLTWLKALLAQEQGDYRTALDTLKAGLELNPESARLHATRGTTLIRHADSLPLMQRPSQYMQAIRAYQTALQLDQDCLEAHIGLAQYYFHAPEIAGGNLERSAEHAQHVHRLNPDLAAPLLQQIESRQNP